LHSKAPTSGRTTRRPEKNIRVISVEKTPTVKTHHRQGVAIVIANSLLNTILDVQPISSRCIAMTLNQAAPITIISAYGPTAQYTAEKKEKFYQELDRVFRPSSHSQRTHDITRRHECSNTSTTARGRNLHRSPHF
jgi:exonuclease III